jgi:hypothetical protein
MAIYKSFVLRDAGVWKRFVAFVRANWSERQPLQVIVTDPEKPRTSEQNRYVWALMREIAANAWANGQQFSAEVWFEYYARRFGVCDEMVLPDGEIVQRRRSTTEMSAADFSEFIEEIKAHAASELGIELSI